MWGLDLSKQKHESPKLKRWKGREVTCRSALLLPSATLHLKRRAHLEVTCLSLTFHLFSFGLSCVCFDKSRPHLYLQFEFGDKTYQTKTSIGPAKWCTQNQTDWRGKPGSRILKTIVANSNFGKYITSTQTFLLSASSEKTKTITTTLRLLYLHINSLSLTDGNTRSIQYKESQYKEEPWTISGK